jgi:NDP-sugar pyrophosphorylase family protein
MKAMILAAGLGTRLWPLTEGRSKPAIPFLNRPLISYSVDYVRAAGIRDIIINLHHQPESITEALGDGSALGVNIEYSFEEEILGTSGALDRVRDALGDDHFVVINGKIVTDIDLNAAIIDHRNRDAIATLALRKNTARERFSIVETDERGLIEKFAGFPDPLSSGEPPLMFTGIQVLSPHIFEYIPQGRFSHSTIDVYPQAIARRERVIAHVAQGSWYEMSTLERYLDASILFMRKQGLSNVVGPGSLIEPGAEVEDSVLWEGVRVEGGARINRSVLAAGVRISAGTQIENAVVTRLDSLRSPEGGEVAGENIIVRLV